MFQADDGRIEDSLNDAEPSRWEADHWQRIQELFHLASAAPPEDRQRILQDACANPAVTGRVLELLASSEEPADQPLTASAPLGTRVGPYALLRHLGTGGLGSVYLAQRVLGGAIQNCAVKVLAMHAAGPQFEARFQREQQILANLDHPHITRMLDAGFSETNQPYLVMEYVDGVDVVRYCNEGRCGISERVQLFLQICDAVAYAHRNLIVHLDLKPSNVLVSHDGQIKLLDFGTSKLIDPDSSVTTTILATPAYAAPEQLRNEAVTTACDVYGLGAVLYELLCGERPWGNTSPTGVLERAFHEQEPQPVTERITAEAALARGASSPERLRSELSGDLQSITAQCLRSRPGERYALVDHLADDLRRYLEGLPVSAREKTFTYKAGKFLRRNWKAAAATLAVSLVLIVAVIFGYERQQQALREGKRAERMQSFLYSLLRLANTNYTGRPATTIPEFLQLGVQALPEFIREPADQRSARLSLGESMFDNSDYEHALPVLLQVRDEAQRAGDVPSTVEATAFAGMTQSELGKYDEASRLLEAAMRMRDQKRVTDAQRLWVVGFYVSNRYNSGVRANSDAVLLQGQIDKSKQSAIPDRELAWALGNLATLYSRLSQQDQARHVARESLDVLQRQPYTSCDQAFTFNLLGDLDMYDGNDDSAVRNYRAGYEMITSCKGPDDLGSLELRIPLARLLVKDKKSAEAVQLLEPAIPIWRRILPGNPEIGYALTTLAQAEVQLGNPEKAAALAQDALTAQTGKIKPDSAAMGLTYAVLAQGLEGQGKRREALSPALEADHIFDKLPMLSPITRQVMVENKAELERLRRP